MDERVFKIKIGRPIPDWDAKHRLPITGCVAPEYKDSATVHRINSVFMDVSEQPQMMRQWLAGGTFTAAFFSVVFLIFAIFFSMTLGQGTGNLCLHLVSSNLVLLPSDLATYASNSVEMKSSP